jgi:leucyl-tRNA synthetase
MMWMETTGESRSNCIPLALLPPARSAAAKLNARRTPWIPSCVLWYHLRYLAPMMTRHPFDQDEYDYWMPGRYLYRWYRTCHHALMYTRFFHKACRDLGIVEGKEPMLQLRNQGQIWGRMGSA